ncbi:hypothetical protein OUZ56_032701 [Daphnia magna]|uniref:Uncharacterized protein n=1 Tax=Daphnia magna TaxID=35525 RepID=A0ABQ9ZWV3_9CRUS|nr:hypothetical protein OUZ56_032701 [Daphnia magna]
MSNEEHQQEDLHPVVEEVPATRQTSVHYNSERGYIYHKRKTTIKRRTRGIAMLNSMKGGSAPNHPPELHLQQQLAFVNANAFAFVTLMSEFVNVIQSPCEQAFVGCTSIGCWFHNGQAI